jgi:hypothetical protein
MKKKWIVIVASGFLLAACGDNKTDTTYNEKTTDVAPTTDATPTVPPPEYNPPIIPEWHFKLNIRMPQM